MARTQVNARQILNRSIQEEDLDIYTPGKSLITRVLPGKGISLESTGIDSGTGAVTVNVMYSKFIGLIGDGSTNLFTITHGLNSTDILIQVHDTTNGQVVYPPIEIVDENNIKIIFLPTPRIDQYKIVVFT